MSTPHRIRLRGPWECRPLAWSGSEWADSQNSSSTVPAVTNPPTPVRTIPTERPLPEAGLLTMPSDWSPIAGPDFRGRVLFTRRFGCPSGIVDDDRVELVVEAVDQRASIELNGQMLGETRWGAGPWRLEITDRLRPANELRITVDLPAEPRDRGERAGKPGGLIGEVRLEIHEHSPGIAR
ncbi:MAG: glycosyl hydrolase 2 galactose-binding domain-containing protein [Planctomycetota bacterium]